MEKLRWPAAGMVVAVAAILLIGPGSRCAAALSLQSSATHSAEPGSLSTATTPLSREAMNKLPPEQRGDLYMIYGRYVSAIAAYREAPRSAELWNKIGVAYHHLNAIAEARHDYRRALMIQPNYPQAINNLGATYFADHNYKKSIELYRHALRLLPHSAVIAANLGTAYFAQGKFRQGMRAYNKAFRLDPAVFSNPDSLNAPGTTNTEYSAQEDYCLAELFAQAGMQKQALEWLARAFNEGFSDRKRLMQDGVFATLRQTREFAALMAQQKAK